MSLFDMIRNDKKEVTIEDCAKMVNSFLKKNRMNPSEHKMKNSEGLKWWIQRGSALTYITLHPHAKEPTIRLYAPILYLPEEHILPFYRRCLELNMELIDCAFGAFNDKIAVVIERPIKGLSTQGLARTIHYLTSVADKFDDKLSAEFQAKMCMSRSEG